MSKLGHSALLLSVLLNVCPSWTYVTLNNVQKVFENVILARDRRVRPVVNQSRPLIVRVSLELISLVDVDEVRQILSTNVLLTLRWRDELRTWNTSDYGGLTNISPEPLDVWRPRLFVSNTVEERDMFEDNYAPLTVYHNGTTIWQPGGMLYTSCHMTLARYPFDKHHCELIFTAGQTKDKIQFSQSQPNVSLEFYESNGEWDLSTTRIEANSASKTLDKLPHMTFHFQIQRKVKFAILCILMPVNVISYLPALVFITPVSSGERVSFSITVFLSLTFSTEQLSGNFPKSSESLPFLVMYLAALLMFSGLAVCVNLIVLMKQCRNEHSTKIQLKSKNAFSDAEEEARTSSDFVSFIDRVDRDIPSLSRTIHQSRQEMPVYFEPMTLTPEQESGHANLISQETYGFFGNIFKKLRPKAKNNDTDSKEKKFSLHNSCTMFKIFKKINKNDVRLFLMFSGAWILLAVSFGVLHLSDYDRYLD